MNARSYNLLLQDIKVYKKHINLFIKIYLILTVLIAYIPIMPLLPDPSLDMSWSFAMNEAVAQHLRIGTDIIFTFGPYASLYSKLYCPETDYLMLFSGSLLAVSCILLILYLAQGFSSLYLFGIAFILSLTGVNGGHDMLFFSYPLLMVFAVYKFVEKNKYFDFKNKKNIVMVVFLFLSFGLLPLVKGSYLPLCVALDGLIVLYTIANRHFLIAAIATIVPMISAVMLWLVSGQQLSDILNYILNMLPIISNYTDAMAYDQWQYHTDIYLYLTSSVFIITSFFKLPSASHFSKIFIISSLIIFLFICFKAGFVRHDAHAIICADVISLTAIFSRFIGRHDKYLLPLVLSIMTTVNIYRLVDFSAIGDVDVVFGEVSNLYQASSRTYIDAWDGLILRLNDKLPEKFQKRVNDIHRQLQIPNFAGNTDIYSYDQSYLLVSTNHWNPRPIIQSYSAYTIELERLNEQHLRTMTAPDNLLFLIQPMDNHLPSLEDGLSWTAIFDNYTMKDVVHGIIHLTKNKTIKLNSTFQNTTESVHKLGESVPLPVSGLPLYAEIDLPPTFLGKLLQIIYKPPQLLMTVTLVDGTKLQYHVISQMMRSGFFISPLVKNTDEFSLLAAADQSFMTHARVRGISIESSYGGTLFWSPEYKLILKPFNMTATPNVHIESGVDSELARNH